MNFPPLTHYAAHVIKVKVFFHISVSRGFISANRPSSMIDIAYLHYLPFCYIFISGDKLHRKVAPLFLKGNQSFVWGPDLKEDLSNLNEYYMKYPEEIKEKGIISFASKPLVEGDFLTAELWALISTSWRTRSDNHAPLSDESNEKLLKHIKGFTEAPTLPLEEAAATENEIESLTLQRAIKKKRGSWYQIPKDYKNG